MISSAPCCPSTSSSRRWRWFSACRWRPWPCGPTAATSRLERKGETAMQNFLTLLGYELRKLLARRALWVAEALLCLVFWSAWSALLFGWAGGYLEYGVFGRGARDFTARVRAAMAAGDLA